MGENSKHNGFVPNQFAFPSSLRFGNVLAIDLPIKILRIFPFNILNKTKKKKLFYGKN